MKIDWAALGLVSIASLAATLVVVGIASVGIRALAAAQSRAKTGDGAVGLRAVGYTFIGLSGVAVLFGIYLIVPALH